MKYQVYIERCRDNSPGASRELADAIAARFGVSSADIQSRLENGRFRIKTNLDLDRAKSFMSYLEANGALCSILDGSGMGVARSSALRGAAPRAESKAIEVKTMDIPRVAIAELELEPELQLESEPPLQLDPTHVHKSAPAPEQEPTQLPKSAPAPELDPAHVHKSAPAPKVTFRTQKSAPELDPTHVHKSTVAGGAASGRPAAFGSMQLSTLDGIDPAAELANTAQSEHDFLPPDMAQEEEQLEVEQAGQAPARTAQEVPAAQGGPAAQEDILELQPYSEAVSTPAPMARATESGVAVGGTAQASSKS